LSLPAGSGDETAALAAREAIERNPVWYHTIEVAPGVVTPGQVDLRKTASRILPDDLSAERALDVGTFDGFWAFEMEGRGADVVSIDVDRIESAEWPPRSRSWLEREVEARGMRLGLGFELASALLGSRVARVICNVYDLSPEAVGGPVEFAFSGALMLHLRDPVRALERIFKTLEPGGELRILEPVSLAMTLRSPRRPAASFQAANSGFNWWVPNVTALSAWLHAAGFVAVRRTCFARPPAARRMRQFYAGFSARRPQDLG
jgi:tRNA (mo5U34)-methyltransferase